MPGTSAASRPIANLSVQQLSYLVAVSKAQSWARAAEELGVTPSALSQGLAELERRLGITLFDWNGRRRVLRAQATEVLAYARRVVTDTQALGRWLDDTRSGRSGELRVGMIDAAAVHHFPLALAAFRAERPALGLRLAVAPSELLLSQLQDGELDVVVCVPPTAAPAELDVTPLLDEPLAVYAPTLPPAKDPSQWGPWVSFPKGSHTRAIVEAALADLGARFVVVAESHQPEVLREMVRLGLGWTVLPVAQAESAPSPLRRARRRAIASRCLAAVRRAEGPPDPAADELVLALVASARRTTEGHRRTTA